MTVGGQTVTVTAV